MAWLIPLFPLAAFALLIAAGRRWGVAAGVVASVAVGISALLSLWEWWQHRALAAPLALETPWVTLGDITLQVGIELTRLNLLMLLIVTVVSLLVHIYSLAYMRGDERMGVFFAYLALFTFSMLGIVISPNLLQLYFFWELVGLSSFLLIGFWTAKPEAREAARKAFVMTRIGDVALLAGIILLFLQVGSFAFADIFAAVEEGVLSPGWITLTALLIFVGAIGKSGQLPLHTWLPDAMEGPTPVSALIHAATMVAAGVYLVARAYPLFAASEAALTTVAVVGGLTAIFAATIALKQYDIKRILAYSTMSQLGYMMLALGAGGLVAGVFHLSTHAFFKALLFLGAGAVIHALGGEQDIRRMGGLWKRMPLVSLLFLVGAMALAGIPPFAGFFSKDEILLSTWEDGRYLLFALAMITVFLTAFYMFRLFFVAFAGDPRHRKPHNEWAMQVPMLVLALLTLVYGWINTPWSPLLGSWLEQDGLAPSHPAGGLGWIALLSVLLSLFGIALAWWMYVRHEHQRQETGERLAPVHALLLNKYWVDELYYHAIVRPVRGLGLLLASVDRHVVTGIVDTVAGVASGLSRLGSRLQNGQVQRYSLVSLAGALLLLMLLKWGGVWV